MSEVRIRPGTDADEAFFRDLEMQTTWENLPPEDCERLEREQVWLALEETHAFLRARPGNAIFIAEVDGARQIRTIGQLLRCQRPCERHRERDRAEQHLLHDSHSSKSLRL